MSTVVMAKEGEAKGNSSRWLDVIVIY